MADDNVKEMPDKGGNKPKTFEQMLSEVKSESQKAIAGSFKAKIQAVQKEIDTTAAAHRLALKKMDDLKNEYAAEMGMSK